MALTDILTPDYIRHVLLFGVDLTRDDGTAFPDEMFYHCIRMGMSIMETEFGIALRPVRVTDERHDVSDWEADTYYLFNLDVRPVKAVTAARVRFGSFQPSEIPATWIHVSSKEAAQIQLIPGPEGLEGWSFSGGIPIIGIDALTPRPYTPLWFGVDYTAGFETVLAGTADATVTDATVTGTGTTFLTDLQPLDWVKVGTETKRVLAVVSDTELLMDSPYEASQAGQPVTHLNYPEDIIASVAILASMLPLDTAGDLIAGAGIANFSVGVDGVHESIGTTSSATNSGYGARVIQYGKRLKQLTDRLRRKYHALDMFVL